MSRVLHLNRGKLALSGALLVIGVAAAIFLLRGSAVADVMTWTSDADFDLGAFQGVNHDDPDHDQLQLDATGTTFPLMWIANAGEDTVSKIDTNTGLELARYRTWFAPGFLHGAWTGPAPSRTAVDSDGNVYVANRHFDGRMPEVMKILNTGGIDRNGNGVIDTSVDLDSSGIIEAGEIIDLIDTDGDNIVDPDEILDERIAWIVQVGDAGQLGRSLCIDTGGDIWVGTYFNSQYYRISAADGSLLAGPVTLSGINPYGCLVDRSGTLWSASLSNKLGEVNTNTDTAVGVKTHTGSDYGIALGNGMVYQACSSGCTYIQHDPVGNTFTTPAAISIGALGISVDGNGDIFVGNTGGGMNKFAPDGSLIWTSPAQVGTGEVRGVVADSNGDVWAVHRANNNISKYQGSDGAALGVFPVGEAPYTYSDATGIGALTVTTPTGFWTVIHDSGSVTTDWGTVSWTDFVPEGGTLEVKVRVADTEGGLPGENFDPVSDGVPFTATGRFIEIQVKFIANEGGDSPILFDIDVEFAPPGGYVAPEE